MCERIRAVPDGSDPFELRIDGFGNPIVIRTRVDVRGDALTVDFAGSSGAVNFGVNVCLNVRQGYVSIERAREDYGVAIDPRTLTELPEDTARLRAARPRSHGA